MATMEQLTRFRSELLVRQPRDMCRRFLIFGSCVHLDDDRYYSLKSVIAEKFAIHPNEIIVVGSAKLGFSIVPTKRYRHFGETSDLTDPELDLLRKSGEFPVSDEELDD